MANLDQDLDSQVEFTSEDAEAEKREALGGRHRRGFGYSSVGASENDAKIASAGHKPLRIQHHVHPVPESRIANFGHGMTPHHLTTFHEHRVTLHH